MVPRQHYVPAKRLLFTPKNRRFSASFYGRQPRRKFFFISLLLTLVTATLFFSGLGERFIERFFSFSSANTNPSVTHEKDKGPLAHTILAPEKSTTPESAGLSNTPLTTEHFQKISPHIAQAEAQLIAIYQLISQGNHRQALTKAENLVREYPNFQLAHLVMGDLLATQTQPIKQLGDIAPDKAGADSLPQLQALREESHRRIQALMQRPPEGHIPDQFVALSSQTKHAIAIDASRSRLYLFENKSTGASHGSRAPQMRLIADYYISVGLLGIEKTVEGDKRTPLGVYYITSQLDPSTLPDMYGVGALPINYPNPLDILRGKTGSGIWLHGTPHNQFVRAPLASDGCVVMSNPDLQRLIATVQIRTTPVVIAKELQWVSPHMPNLERKQFEASLNAWHIAKSQAKLGELKRYYSPRFQIKGLGVSQWWEQTEAEMTLSGPREMQIKQISLLRWRDSEDVMVATFDQVVRGQIRGKTLRQYWARENGQWKIFFEAPA